MLRLDRQNKSFSNVGRKTLAEVNILERQHLQEMIAANPDMFFEELQEKLILIGKEVQPSEIVSDRIDLLAIDEKGIAVIIELKRAEDKFQLFQSLSYAAMIEGWKAEKFIQQRSYFANENIEDAQQSIADKLEVNEERNENLINISQRVILLAEKFDYALLRTAEWLTEVYGVTIHIYRIEYFSDANSEYISFPRVYPPQEIVDQASRVRRNKSVSITTSNKSLEERIQNIKNPAAKSFFINECRTAEKTSRNIKFRINGVRRYSVNPRSENAYVWQNGRFEGDKIFWKKHLSSSSRVEEVQDNECLRFYLETSEDFIFFTQAINGELNQKLFKWNSKHNEELNDISE